MSRRPEARPGMVAGGASPEPIQFSDVRAGYGPVEVLHGVSFGVQAGEVVALLGPNGSGKSTCLSVLAGVVGASHGRVRLLGEDPLLAGEAWRARVAYVRQSWQDHGGWQVGRLVAWIAAHYAPHGDLAHPRPRQPHEVLERVGLSGASNQRVEALSGGQRRRLDVALGIVGAPEVLLLDEPTAGLDPEGSALVMDLIAEESARGASVLVSTHALADVERIADRVVLMTSGRVMAHGSVSQLFNELGLQSVASGWEAAGRLPTALPREERSTVQEPPTHGGEFSRGRQGASLAEVYRTIVTGGGSPDGHEQRRRGR